MITDEQLTAMRLRLDEAERWASGAEPKDPADYAGVISQYFKDMRALLAEFYRLREANAVTALWETQRRDAYTFPEPARSAMLRRLDNRQYGIVEAKGVGEVDEKP